MGGRSYSSTRTTVRSAGFPLGDKAKGPFDDLAERMAETAVRQWRARAANHSAHVEAFRKHQEWINRPWTWRNYLAVAINWVFGNA